MSRGVKDEFKYEKRRASQIAKQFCYGEEVIKDIKAAKSINEINNILSTARHGKK